MNKQLLQRALDALCRSFPLSPSDYHDEIGADHRKVIAELRAAIDAPEVELVPPFGSKRAAAMAIYVPPFKYQYGYIFDSQQHMVSDNGPICDGPSVEGAVASRVRGWGRIGYMPNAAELQDEVGQMMADALNAAYTSPPDTKAKDSALRASLEALNKLACLGNGSKPGNSDGNAIAIAAIAQIEALGVK